MDQFGALPTLDELERKYIIWLLIRFEWSRNQVADIMGIHRTTLYRKLKKHRISGPTTADE